MICVFNDGCEMLWVRVEEMDEVKSVIGEFVVVVPGG